MTHPSEDSAIRAAMESLIDNGLDGLGEALRILMNEAMKIERTDFLQAGSYGRSEDRVGHANGFKDKIVRTRFGDVTLQVPKVRGLPDGLVGFYPQSSPDHVGVMRGGRYLGASQSGQPVARRRAGGLAHPPPGRNALPGAGCPL